MLAALCDLGGLGGEIFWFNGRRCNHKDLPTEQEAGIS
jgi:hypothetical protein